jgi:hypothetical protein
LSLPVKVVAIWASFIPVAILNGTLRELCLAPLLGPRLALPLSGICGASLFFLLTFVTLPWLGPLKPRQYRLIGLGWLLMTLLFESLFGRLVAHKSWSELLQSYNPSTGNLWVLMLLVIALSPPCAAKLRHLAE